MKLCTKIVSITATVAFLTAPVFAQKTSGSLKANIAAASVHTDLSTPYLTTSASSTTDDYYVNYIRNLSTNPDQYIEIVDPGTNAPADICADIYVVTPDEELAECCSCQLTPDQLTEVPATNLNGNPANGKAFDNFTVKIVSDPACNAGAPKPGPALRAWAIHEQDYQSVGGHSITESDFLPATLSTNDENGLASTCAFYVKALSGTGSCQCPGQLTNNQ